MTTDVGATTEVTPRSTARSGRVGSATGRPLALPAEPPVDSSATGARPQRRAVVVVPEGRVVEVADRAVVVVVSGHGDGAELVPTTGA